LAGDWIKVQHTTADKPEVMQIAKALDVEPEQVCGHLLRVWAWADQQSLDGHAINVTERDIDRVARHAGFATAMREVGWLVGMNGTLSLPNFDRHNGETAKKRALASDRKRKEREEESRNERDESVTREEKRREELKALPTIVGSPPALEILPSNIPYKEIVTLFNEHMGKLPMVRELTQKRRIAIRTAWQANKRRQSLEFWKRYFEECAEDDFLNGTGPYKSPHETWRPSFDFLMRSDQVTKVYERAMHEAGHGT
jgi:hypothetical protein